MSSRPCVGCAWRPSPALITCTCGAHVARDEVRRAGLRVADHEHVGVHRCRLSTVSSSVSPLVVDGGADVQVDHVGRQALGGDLEGGAGARGVLEEQVEDRLAAQQRDLLHLALGHADEGFGGVEDVREHLARQALDGEEVVQSLRVDLGELRVHAASCGSESELAVVVARAAMFWSRGHV